MNLKRSQYNQYFKMTKGLYGLCAPKSFWDATPYEIKKVCNGCGAGGWKYDVIPDTILGLVVKLACQIHDWMYHFAIKLMDCKEFCDKTFLENMKILNNKTNWLIRHIRYPIIRLYYRGVELGGEASFMERKIPSPKGLNRGRQIKRRKR